MYIYECGFGHLHIACVDNKKKTLEPTEWGFFGNCEPPDVNAGNYCPLKGWYTLLILSYLSSPICVY